MRKMWWVEWGEMRRRMGGEDSVGCMGEMMGLKNDMEYRNKREGVSTQLPAVTR
jgi:hypothetical protein